MNRYQQPLPTDAAALRQLIDDELDRIDPDDALNALEEWYSTYIMHCIEDGVPHELHDSIFALHKTFRSVLHITKKIKEI